MAENRNDRSDVENLSPWDLFLDEPYIDNGKSPEDALWCKILLKILKILACILALCGLLGGAILAKLSLLIMASRIGNNGIVSTCVKTSSYENLVDPIPVPEEERVYWSWLILIAFSLPELLTIFRSLRIFHYKGQEIPSIGDVIVPCTFELIYVTGQALFVFSLLPTIDSVQGVILCTSVYFIPTLLGSFSEYGRRGWYIHTLNIASILLQLGLYLVWVIIHRHTYGYVTWLFPLAAIMTSFGNIFNFIDDRPNWRFLEGLARFKPNLLKSGYVSYAIISSTKIVWFFCMMLFCTWLDGVENVWRLFTKFDDAFTFDVEDKSPYIGLTQNSLNIFLSPLFLQVIGSTVCYWCGKFACKIYIQRFSFALPIVLVVPVSLATLVFTHHFCIYNNPFFGDLKFVIPPGDYFLDNHYWIWCLWYLTQLWATAHIWNPKVEKLAKTEKLFNSPMYSGLLVDQSAALNRKRESDANTLLEPIEVMDNEAEVEAAAPVESDYVQRIYACATMWHETRTEMVELLKSIFKMDKDQAKRRLFLAQGNSRGYYKYETHIFFDDAFETLSVNGPSVVNSFVSTFVDIMKTEIRFITGVDVPLTPPIKFETPYGGRIEWTLPRGTKLLLHLKDKTKIRHKKRWSQCMYMYYLLGYMLKDLTPNRREIRSRNTYILALDGDVCFQPIAVERLVDFMKRSPKLGAACGRIHPTGEPGPILWYQKFEYAIGHWLQKSTEHTLGCVLCSPGCFSLFRGHALMSPNILSKYTQMSSKPLHYIQYDQGEDRWLCTLLLQQGYKVDYSAASDAYTHAPENFDEFYNQRRRWVPSTTANIMDLLADYSKTISVNSDISFPYIFYQSLLMFGTIMGPGTIFLVIVGALHRVFHVNMWLSFFCNLTPIVVYIIVCYFCKSKTQILFAKLLSIIYALVMVTVFVGISLIVVEEGIFAPSSFFLILVSLVFIVAAIMHPLEFDCLIYGLVYCITIPSMYLFLIIFSIFNLDNVSWGTRETEKPKENTNSGAENSTGGSNPVTRQRYSISERGSSRSGCFELSIRGLCDIVCCPKSNEIRPNNRSTNAFLNVPVQNDENQQNQPEMDGTQTEVSCDQPNVSNSLEGANSIEQDYVICWIDCTTVIPGRVGSLPDEESQFWRELIDKYLKPIEADSEKEKQMKAGLIQLRNKIVFNFLMINAIFILLVFILELNKHDLNIRWPYHHLTLEPIGTLFVLFFGLILLIQFCGMLIHRTGTLAHILASTETSFW